MKHHKSLKILFVGAEAIPFVKIGSLRKFLYSLLRALCALGHDAQLMIPRHASIDSEKIALTTVIEGLMGPNPGHEDIVCHVKKYESAEALDPICFLENQEYYEKRDSVYMALIDMMKQLEKSFADMHEYERAILWRDAV